MPDRIESNELQKRDTKRPCFIRLMISLTFEKESSRVEGVESMVTVMGMMVTIVMIMIMMMVMMVVMVMVKMVVKMMMVI